MKPISVNAPEVSISIGEKDLGIGAGSLRARPDIISGLRKTWIHLRIRWTIVCVLIRCYPNPVDWFRGLMYFIRLRRSIMGNHRVRKMIRVGRYYYMGLHIPGWNDDTYRRYIAKALMEFKPHQRKTAKVELAFLAITKKCPLQCEHCSAGETLNMRDEVEVEGYERLIDGLEEQGVFQINFTGGEPLVKFDLLEHLVSRVSPGIKTWVNTSGYGLTREKALRLKKAGLTGVAISLDHYLEEEHNAFRNYKKAYYWALEAAGNALEAGMVVAFSVFLGKEMSEEESLMEYMKLARNTGVHFVQLLEPKAAGNFKNKNVNLSKEAQGTLETFFLKMNFGRDYTAFPLISYHGYYERRVGCLSAGKKGIYIDADGHLNACPFCHTSFGNLLEGSWDEKIQALETKGCSGFSVSVPRG